MAEPASPSRKRLTIEERIAVLDARRATLQARLSKARRTEDTRACIILGRWVMEAAKRDPQVARLALEGLPQFLSRDPDRKVMARTIAELQEFVNPSPSSPSPAPQRPRPAAPDAISTRHARTTPTPSDGFRVRPDTEEI